MLARNVIEPSYSPYASPVVLVMKKGGDWRFCIDYRRLNKITVKDAYPLPRIEDMLEALKDAGYFTVLDLLDLLAGYWQIPLAAEDRNKSAFVTSEELYHFRVLPFGLTNAPGSFMRLINNVLKGLRWHQCVVYLDDIVVFGRTFQEHLDNLDAVLNALRKANLRAKVSKCKFGETEVVYLGHNVTKISRPQTKKQLRGFL